MVDATGEQMAIFRAATRRDITAVDAEAIGRLSKAGITEPSQLQAWVAAAHSTANWDIDRNQSILAWPSMPTLPKQASRPRSSAR